MKLKKQIWWIRPPCPKCPYTLGLIRTTISPCPQCKADGYQAYKRFKSQQYQPLDRSK